MSIVRRVVKRRCSFDGAAGFYKQLRRIARARCSRVSARSGPVERGGKINWWDRWVSLAGFGYLTPTTSLILRLMAASPSKADLEAQDGDDTLQPRRDTNHTNKKLAGAGEFHIKPLSLSHHLRDCYSSLFWYRRQKRTRNSKSACARSGRNIPAGPSLPTQNQAHLSSTNS